VNFFGEKNMRIKLELIFVSVMLSAFSVFAQDSTVVTPLTKQESITLATRISHTEVPLNRTVNLHVSIKWRGSADRYEILDFENPALTNLEIVGTASSNRSEVVQGVVYTYKDYDFTLRPRELGMGYVEGVIIKYRNTATNQEQSLITNRISLKVIDPIPEEGSEANILWIVASGGILILAGGGGWYYWRRKRRRNEEEISAPPPLIEESFLQELKQAINWDMPEFRQSFATLSKLYRRYLTQKFDLGALEFTTDELLRTMQEKSLDDWLIRDTREILTNCDLVKFSGDEGTRESLERIYGLIEKILERNLAEASVAQEENSKTK